MNNRKNQNSILVLATLGVYLGLVLAGATPQVLAQAAMAKQFNVKDEIEKQDELDNKPDGCRVAKSGREITELDATYLWFNHRTISEYAHLVEQIIDAYSDVDAFNVGWKSIGDFRPGRTVTTTTDFVGTDRSAHDFDEDVIFVGNGLHGKSFSFSATKDDSGYSSKFESNAIPYDPPLVRYLYRAAFDFRKCFRPEQQEIILRHTEIKVEGTNLIVSTRLPRGALDLQLAKDAK